MGLEVFGVVTIRNILVKMCCFEVCNYTKANITPSQQTVQLSQVSLILQNPPIEPLETSSPNPTNPKLNERGILSLHRSHHNAPQTGEISSSSDS